MDNWNFLTDVIPQGALLLDCRSEGNYAHSTIKGAIGAANVKKPYGSGPQSMSRLHGFMAAVLAYIKENNYSSVVAFDEGVGMYASRMVWLLLSSGYKDVKMYNKKFSEVPDSDLGPGMMQIEPVTPPPELRIGAVASINYVQKNLTKVQLLDVRTPDEYEGRLPRMMNLEPGSICGRIPGSLNWDWRSLYTEEGMLKERSQVINDIRRIGLIQERPTVIYDFNGARSATTALILSRCGYKQISIYMGSWMEWRKTQLPKQALSTWHG